MVAYAQRHLLTAPPVLGAHQVVRPRSGVATTSLIGSLVRAAGLGDWLNARFFRRCTRHLAGDFIYHEPNYVLRPFAGLSIATLHDLTWLHFPQYVRPATRRWLEAGLPRTLKEATHFVAVSEFVAQELTQYLGIPSARISVTPLGVDPRFSPRGPAELVPALNPLGLKPGCYLLTVSTREPRKNLVGLMRAYQRLPQTLRRHYPLVLAGPPGWEGHELEAVAQSLTSQGCLHTLGYVEDGMLPAVYAGARAFAFPSFYEGFGLPALEAMASGVPVLTSNRAAMAEVCGEAAWLADPDDVESIAEGLERVLTDSSLRRARVSRGLERARGFTWGRTVEATVGVYRQVLALGA